MADASIVKQGTKGDAFYVVLKGQAKVTSNERFIRRLLPGDHFGEIAAIDGGMRSATVTSETPMTLAVMTRRPADEGAPRRPGHLLPADGRARPDVPPASSRRPYR